MDVATGRTTFLQTARVTDEFGSAGHAQALSRSTGRFVAYEDFLPDNNNITVINVWDHVTGNVEVVSVP